MEIKDIVNPEIKILIVDDLKSARITVRSVLGQLGLKNTIEAVDGLDALEKLSQNTDVGLIICDWMMPNMEGIVLAEKLQSDPRFQNIPIIMATSKSELADLAEATIQGVWGYVIKPVCVDGLSKEIAGVFTEPEIL